MKLGKSLILILLIITFSINVNASLRDSVNEMINSDEFIVIKIPDIIGQFTAKIEVTDTNEVFYLSIEKEGKFSTLVIKDEGKEDVILRGTEDNLFNLLNSDEETLKSNIELVEIEPITFKGRMAVEFAEQNLNVKIVKKKKLGDKLARITIFPVVKLLTLIK